MQVYLLRWAWTAKLADKLVIESIDGCAEADIMKEWMNKWLDL
jgi:hypothetical protein